MPQQEVATKCNSTVASNTCAIGRFGTLDAWGPFGSSAQQRDIPRTQGLGTRRPRSRPRLAPRAAIWRHTHASYLVGFGASRRRRRSRVRRWDESQLLRLRQRRPRLHVHGEDPRREGIFRSRDLHDRLPPRRRSRHRVGRGQQGDQLRLRRAASRPPSARPTTPGETPRLRRRVTVTATPAAPNTVFAFAGSLHRVHPEPCTVSGNAERLVMVRFAVTDGVGTHPNYSDPALHGPAFRHERAPCNACHGANLQGAGLAVACASCHDGNPAFPITFPLRATAPIAARRPLQRRQAPRSAITARAGAGLPPLPHEPGLPRLRRRGRLRRTTPRPRRPRGQDDERAHEQRRLPASTPAPATARAYTYGPLKCETCHNAASGADDSAHHHDHLRLVQGGHDRSDDRALRPVPPGP